MVDLSSFPNPFNAVVVGATGGIGAAFTNALLAQDGLGTLIACSRHEPDTSHEKLHWAELDVADEASIEKAAQQASEHGPFQLVICAVGILHGEGLDPEKSLKALDPEKLIKSFTVNTVGPALVAKHFIPLLEPRERAIFAAMSARIGSIGDNRIGGWHGYRASKAALNMMIKNFAIETGRRHKQMICVGLHPGTVDTGLSKPFQNNIPGEQIVSPDEAAGNLLQVLDGLTPENSGRCFAWDGETVAY